MSSPSLAVRKRTRPEDWGDNDPSPVIHVRGLTRHTLEKDLVQIFSCFGRINDVTMIPQKNQALIEYEDVSSAEKVVLKSEDIKVLNAVVQVSFSTSKHIVQRAANRMPVEEQNNMSSDNHILLFTIYHTDRPITVDLIHRITSQYGHVVRIVIFRKAQVQAMVEFTNVSEARTVKLNLNGADIFPNSCTLKVDYARPTRLTVNKNDQDSWDYEKIDNASSVSNNMRLSMNSFHPSSLLNNVENFAYNVSHQSLFECSNGFVQPYIQQQFRDSNNVQHVLNGVTAVDDRGTSWVSSAVIMIYNIDMKNMNCDRLFNILCLYGNVLRIKFLKTKEGSAMAEMGDVESAGRVISNLSRIHLMNQQLIIRSSKQKSLSDVTFPYELSDGSLSFKDYTYSRNNRYSTAEMVKKNRIHTPSRILHYWNAPPNLNANDLSSVIVNCGAGAPECVCPFVQAAGGGGKTISGTIHWATDTDAFAALAICNHLEIQDPMKPRPFILKLAFANPVLHNPNTFVKNFQKHEANGAAI